MPPSPGWQWDTETVAAWLPRLRDWEAPPNSLRSTSTPPKFPPPNSPGPAAAIQVGYRAGTASPPPPCRELGVSWRRGPKSSQTLGQEPQTLVTPLILGRGPDGGPWETPPHSGKLGSDWYKPLSPAGAGKQSCCSWWFLGVTSWGLGRSDPPWRSAGTGLCVQLCACPGDTAAPRSPHRSGPHTSPESQDGGRAAPTPPPAPAAP